MKRLTVPAGSFPGLAAPSETVGSCSFGLARPGLDDALAYRIVRALARADLGATQPRNLLGIVPAAWINPGTARYLTEAGFSPR